MATYECYFSIGDGELSTEIPDIATALNGFWTDECFEYATASDDIVYWIAPASVKYVKKINDGWRY
jgi:hypothetical protein